MYHWCRFKVAQKECRQILATFILKSRMRIGSSCNNKVEKKRKKSRRKQGGGWKSYTTCILLLNLVKLRFLWVLQLILQIKIHFYQRLPIALNKFFAANHFVALFLSINRKTSRTELHCASLLNYNNASMYLVRLLFAAFVVVVSVKYKLQQFSAHFLQAVGGPWCLFT